MKIIQSKLDRQIGIIDRWIAMGCKGTVEACTGFGKTYILILVIQRLHRKYPGAPVDVVVPKLDLQQDWIKWDGHINKHGLQNVEVFVVNTYITLGRRNPILLGLDEGHRYASDEFGRVFEVAGVEPVEVSVGKAPFCMLLTATLERLDGRHDYLKRFAPVVDTVTLHEARQKGWVSKFKTYNWGLEFTPEEKAEYEEVTNLFNIAFAKFEHNFDLAMACGRPDSVYTKVVGVTRNGREWRREKALSMGWDGENNEDDWSPRNIFKYAAQFNNCMRARKTLIYRAFAKLEAIQQLVDKFPVKTITFAEDSIFADKVAEMLGEERCKAYHTKIKGTVVKIRTEKLTARKGLQVTYKDKRISAKDNLNQIKEDFIAGKYQVMSTVKKVDEGLDDPTVRMAIQASYSSGKTQDTQRGGRAFRIDELDDTKMALHVNLYIKDSQEEKWLKNKQEGKRDILWVDSIDEITIDEEDVINLA